MVKRAFWATGSQAMSSPFTMALIAAIWALSLGKALARKSVPTFQAPGRKV